MANRYWVGGTANWDGTAGTKWSDVSNGTGGASVPTSADDVFFDSASTGTVTLSVSTTIKSITCTGFTGTLAGSGNLTVAGNITLTAGMGYTNSGTITISATGTVITAGKTLSNFTINGSGITATLGDALTSSGTVTLTQGTFTTANYNISCATFSSSNSNTRTINLGSSTVTVSGSLLVATNTNFTFNAGTSTFIITGTGGIGGTPGGTGLTFYNLSYTSTTANISNTVSSINTFNNISITAPASAGSIRNITFDSRQTINGVLSTNGTAGNRRVQLSSSVTGLAHTITVVGTPSLTDCDFRDIRVVGAAAPISGTRIGDLGNCTGITFSAPKTVYWVLSVGGSWGADGTWSDQEGGTPSTTFFPLPQDTAKIVNTGLNSGGTISISPTSVLYLPTIDFGSRTNPVTVTPTFNFGIYGNLILSSAVTFSTAGAPTIIFAGHGKTQTITSNGGTLALPVEINKFGGTVQLADALNLPTRSLTVTNGTFDTKNYAVTAGSLISNNSNVRNINLGSSTITLSSSAVTFTTSTNLTFNAGTSTIIGTGGSGTIACGSGCTFYNLDFTSTQGGTIAFTGNFTCNNLSFTSATGNDLRLVTVNSSATINGTFTCAGATAIRRIFVLSNTLGTARTITVNSLVATDCDFRDITIAGAAAGSSPTRAGDCGGNSGIIFPASKTVYWNLSGTQFWTATAWSTQSNGTPNIDNFPLAQDTAVFDNAGSAGIITIPVNYNIGSIDMSSRTSAMTIQWSQSNNNAIYGDLKAGTGVTFNNNWFNFVKNNGTQTITSNGVDLKKLNIEGPTTNVVLADALTLSTGALRHDNGSFDAVTYNVTATGYNGGSTSNPKILRMGSGTWTMTGTSEVWNTGTLTLYKDTANIVLSNTSTTARTFAGGSLAYNKLTIGGTTGTSTLTISGNNFFSELASTKTVAHTIALGTTVQTFGKWTVTGTSGNVVTLTGTGTNHHLAGSATSGIDYLAMGSIGFNSGSRGEFYAGANSTGTASAPVYRTAAPAARTLYWVGGTGNWSSTTKWSTTSNGSGGEATPTSLDNVIFNSSSGSANYTVTVDAVSRCNSLTISGPSSGTLTFAGANTLICHNNITLPATGFIRTFTGNWVLSGSTTGKVLTTNGVTLGSSVIIEGEGSEWTLGSALTTTAGAGHIIYILNGTFKSGNYSISTSSISISNCSPKLYLGSSTVTIDISNAWGYLNASYKAPGFLFYPETSTVIFSSSSPNTLFNWTEPITFYNVSLSAASNSAVLFPAAEMTVNNLTLTPPTSSVLKPISLQANLTINGTFTCSNSIDATKRVFIQSNTIGTTRTITLANAPSLTDVDFRDIAITGAASPVSGTRLGDCKGNSGITFPAPKTVYWNLAGSNNWSATAWATEQGGTPAANNFPLAQDTAIITSSSPASGSTITVDRPYNIGTIDSSARTSILNHGLFFTHGNQTMYGDLIAGAAVSASGTGTVTWAGRNTQTINVNSPGTSIQMYIESPGGTLRLNSALINSGTFANQILLTAGTLDLNGYTLTISNTGTNTGFAIANSTNSKTLAFGSSGILTIARSSSTAFSVGTATNTFITGTGTIRLTSTSSKTFAGGGVNYGDVTLEQAGTGTLTITGNNTFKTISDSHLGSSIISLGNTTQTITSPLLASGYEFDGLGNYIQLLGLATIVYTGGGSASNVNYMVLDSVRLYPIGSWYVGSNSITNQGVLGAVFSSAPSLNIRSQGYILQ